MNSLNAVINNISMFVIVRLDRTIQKTLKTLDSPIESWNNRLYALLMNSLVTSAARHAGRVVSLEAHHDAENTQGAARMS